MAREDARSGRVVRYARRQPFAAAASWDVFDVAALAVAGRGAGGPTAAQAHVNTAAAVRSANTLAQGVVAVVTDACTRTRGRAGTGTTRLLCTGHTRTGKGAAGGKTA